MAARMRNTRSLCTRLRERDDVAVGIEERELCQAVPLRLERQHDLYAILQLVVRTARVVDFDEERQRATNRPTLESRVLLDGWSRRVEIDPHIARLHDCKDERLGIGNRLVEREPQYV